jgi:hypothetical protein
MANYAIADMAFTGPEVSVTLRHKGSDGKVRSHQLPAGVIPAEDTLAAFADAAAEHGTARSTRTVQLDTDNQVNRRGKLAKGEELRQRILALGKNYVPPAPAVPPAPVVNETPAPVVPPTADSPPENETGESRARNRARKASNATT